MLDDYDFAQFDGMEAKEILDIISKDARFEEISKVLISLGILTEIDTIIFRYYGVLGLMSTPISDDRRFRELYESFVKNSTRNNIQKNISENKYQNFVSSPSTLNKGAT